MNFSPCRGLLSVHAQLPLETAEGEDAGEYVNSLSTNSLDEAELMDLIEEFSKQKYITIKQQNGMPRDSLTPP
jgi:hypothetical protein